MCVEGGNDTFITEAYSTNFHTFTSRHMILTPADSPDRYREVTAAERARIEADDAKWQQPPQAFVELIERSWNNVRYNPATGYFEVEVKTATTPKLDYSIKDIDYSEMIEMYNRVPKSCGTWNAPFLRQRVNLYPLAYGNPSATLTSTGYATDAIVAQLTPTDGGYLNTGDVNMSNCTRLKAIIGHINANGHVMLSTNPMLEYFTCTTKRENATIDVRNSPLLNRFCMEYLANRQGTAMTLLVHPDVYAKLTGENPEADWTELFAQLQAKKITIQTP